MKRTVLLLVALSSTACLMDGGGPQSSIGAAPRDVDPRPRDTFVPPDPVSHPPFDKFHAAHKHCIDIPYVYVEHRGPYHEATARIPGVLWEAREQGLESAGPPFALYYDDPAQVAPDQLRSRICVPLASARSPVSPLRYDVLPSRMVAYAYVSGAYDAVPRCYPHLFAYLDKFRWELDGPIYESYIVSPAEARTTRELLTEVRFPIRQAQ